MTPDSDKYDSKTVRALRGTETRTIKKLEQSGWEVVSEAPGRLRTELTLRRPRPKKPWLLLATGGGFVALLIAFALIMGVLEGDDPSNEPSPSPAASHATEPSEHQPSAPDAVEGETSGIDAASPSEDEIVTAEDSHDFAALLTVGDYCSEQVATFASDYAGRTVQFDGSIDALGPHGEYDTRYDFLISAGEFSETSSNGGPAFQVRDAGTFDLHLTGDESPETVGVGDNLRITAEVDRYIPEQCLLLLEPVETIVR